MLTALDMHPVLSSTISQTPIKFIETATLWVGGLADCRWLERHHIDIDCRPIVVSGWYSDTEMLRVSVLIFHCPANVMDRELVCKMNF